MYFYKDYVQGHIMFTSLVSLNIQTDYLGSFLDSILRQRFDNYLETLYSTIKITKSFKNIFTRICIYSLKPNKYLISLLI